MDSFIILALVVASEFVWILSPIGLGLTIYGLMRSRKDSLAIKKAAAALAAAAKRCGCSGPGATTA